MTTIPGILSSESVEYEVSAIESGTVRIGIRPIHGNQIRYELTADEAERLGQELCTKAVAARRLLGGDPDPLWLESWKADPV